jgi:hypothetical protein
MFFGFFDALSPPLKAFHILQKHHPLAFGPSKSCSAIISACFFAPPVTALPPSKVCVLFNVNFYYVFLTCTAAFFFFFF